MEKIQEKLIESLPYLKEATELSASSAFKVAKTLFIFGLTNIILITVGLVYLFQSEVTQMKWILVLTLIIIGIASTFFAVTKMYQQVLINAGKVYFDKLDVFKNNFAEHLIDKLENNSDTKWVKSVNQLVNVPQIINNSYQNVPKIISKAISYLISKIPLIEYVDVINKDFFLKEKEQKITYLVSKTNTFFEENIFSINNAKVINKLFFIMILVQIVLIYFIKK